MFLKRKLTGAFRSMGFNVTRYNGHEYGRNINEDVIRILNTILQDNQQPLIFDVGSNVGQSISFYKSHFPLSVIHAFEPGKVFDELKRNTSAYKDITYNRLGVGAKAGEAVFVENQYSDVSSFLEPTEKMWGDVVSRTQVQLISIDAYMAAKQINKIDFLKIDTQGFDFEVLKGATTAMQAGNISLIQLEITLSALYDNLPTMDEIIRFLFNHGFRLVAFYGFHNKHIASQWTDCLFIHESAISSHE